MTRQAKPFEPADRKMTLRRKIVSLLSDRPLSAKRISALAGISEKEVYAHLPHVGRTVGQLGRRLVVTPAECNGCGFVFRKRDRPTRPGRCPVCRGESISEPLFSLRREGSQG